MKKYITFLCVAVCFVLASCSSSKKFTVSGTPGTVIADQYYKQLAVIDETGNKEIKLSTTAGYTPYLLAKAPNSNAYYPFALDFRKGKSKRKYAVIGGAAAMAGGFGIAMSDSEVGAGFGVGLGVAVVGEMVAIISAPLMRFEILYEYDPQQTNNDLFIESEQ